VVRQEAVQHLRVMMVAAHEPTADFLAKALKEVLTNPAFRSTLAGGTQTRPDALQTVLWREPPMTTNIGRWASGDHAVFDKPVKRGDMILLGLAAANHDPAVQPDDDTDLVGNRSHLAFSRGPHECPGQDWGIAIVDTGMDTLLSELPDLRLAVDEEDLEYEATLMQRKLKALPCTYEARRSAPPTPAPTASVELPPQREPVPAPTPAPPVEEATRGSLGSRLRQLLTGTR
jgi:cytochrome P450